MTMFLALLAVLLVLPGAAAADPVSNAIFTWLATAGVPVGTATAIATATVQFIKGLGLSLLGQLFQEKPKVKQRGIQTEQTTTGDVTPLTFIVGRYSTEGHLIAPGYSRGKNNKILTYIVGVSDIPVTGLSGRVAINGEWTDLVADGTDPDKYWFADLGDGTKGWLWFFDGTQTTAFQHLVDEYGSHPDRPWTTDHIIEGGAYAVMEFWFDREVYSGFPRFRFEIDGIPLYDPRKDSTVGGSGSHRWSDTSTWELTKNPQVINYNILRGITLPNGDIYGGLIPAEDLPLDNWFAAMNACDALIGSRPTYEVGFEIDVSQEPFDVIKEMNKASFAQMSELGGVFKVRVGAPASPVLSITDDDIVITKPADLNPFPGLAQTSNAITGTYVEPNDVWQGRAADPIYNPTWEADDGDRRLTTDVGLPAVSNKSQAQHLLNSLINDNRRFATHGLVLPASFATLEPLDTIEWTSKRNGYIAKVFEVVELEDHLDTMLQYVRVREREATDTFWTTSDDVPAPSPVNGITPPGSFELEGFSAFQVTVRDSTGAARDAGIGASWDTADLLDGILGVHWQIRESDGTVVFQGAEVPADNGNFSRVDGIVPGRTYYIRARLLASVPTGWTADEKITAPAVLLTQADFDPSVTDYVKGIAAGTLAPLELENMNVVERVDLHPDWTGTTNFDGTAGSTDIRNGHLYITPGAADQTVTHTDAVTHDLGGVFQSRVTAALGSMFWNASDTWDTWGTWDTVGTWAGNIEGCAAHIEVRHTQDDPAGSPSWSEWAKPEARLITARAYQFRVVATFGNTDHRLRLTRATIVIDVPDRIIAAEDLAIPVEGLTYDFDPPFMDRPAVSVTPENIADGVRVVVTGKSAAGVTIQLLDGSDTGQAGTVDLLAKGFGRQT
jgi:hypothetical protein